MKIDLHFHFDSFQELNEFQAALSPPVEVAPGTIVGPKEPDAEALAVYEAKLATSRKNKSKSVDVTRSGLTPDSSFPSINKDVNHDVAPVPLSLDDIRAKVSLVIEKNGLLVATKIIKACKVNRIAELKTVDYVRVFKACDNELKT